MNWYYDKTKIISIIVAAVVIIGSLVGSGFAIANNAQTNLDVAEEAIYSELATKTELEEAVDNLPTQQDLVDLSKSADELQNAVEEFIDTQSELNTAQQLVIDGILNRLDDVEDDLAHIWGDLYGEDGIWELLFDAQRDIDYLWNYIATH